MSCKISVSGWQGDDRTVVIKKISKMFRITPEMAIAIMDKLGVGVPWRFDHPVSDRQGKEAKAFLVSMGFRVALTPTDAGNKGMGLGVDLYAGQEDLEEAPPNKGFLARLKEKFARRGE